MKKALVFLLFVLLAAGNAYAVSWPWTWEYEQDNNTARTRGVAVKAEDDFAMALQLSPYGIQWYHSAPVLPGAYDCTKTGLWIMGEDTVIVSYNWGLGIDVDDNIYLTNQNEFAGPPADSSANVLVWDYNCNEVDYLDIGHCKGSSFPTACDVDAAGNVYVAFYVVNTTFHDQIEVYPDMSQWVNHTAAKLTGFDGGAVVVEGLCVNAAGTVIWVVDRGLTDPYTIGGVRRFVGDPVNGYTQDMSFAGDGLLDMEPDNRGIDVDETWHGGRIFVLHDTYPSAGDFCLIANATTGAKIDTIWTYTDGNSNYHPYDVEYEPVGGDLYIAHKNLWLVEKWHDEWAVAVTMSSFEATAGQEMVDLTWRVESEVDNQGFNLYRDGEKIAFVQSQGNTDAPRTYNWVDKDVTAGITYSYKIADVSLEGLETMYDFVATATPKASAGLPTEYWLSQNYPNPFNADTHIEFKLADAGYTTLKIYNTTGQLVRTLVDGYMEATHHKVRWDGRNEYGGLVASGIYFYRLSSGKFAEMKKMSFLR
jgi:hypothetical protein